MARSRTSKRYLPRFSSSSGRSGLPGNGSGSSTTRSRAKRSSVALPVWKTSTRSVRGVGAGAAAIASARRREACMGAETTPPRAPGSGGQRADVDGAVARRPGDGHPPGVEGDGPVRRPAHGSERDAVLSGGGGQIRTSAWPSGRVKVIAAAGGAPVEREADRDRVAPARTPLAGRGGAGPRLQAPGASTVQANALRPGRREYTCTQAREPIRRRGSPGRRPRPAAVAGIGGNRHRPGHPRRPVPGDHPDALGAVGARPRGTRGAGRSPAGRTGPPTVTATRPPGTSGATGGRSVQASGSARTRMTLVPSGASSTQAAACRSGAEPMAGDRPWPGSRVDRERPRAEAGPERALEEPLGMPGP